MKLNMNADEFSEYCLTRNKALGNMFDNLPFFLSAAIEKADGPLKTLEKKFETRNQFMKALSEESKMNCDNYFRLYQVYCLLSEIYNSDKEKENAVE